MLLLSIANSIEVAIFHIFAQSSKCDQKSFFKSFAQDSKSKQKIINCVLPGVANLAKYHFILKSAQDGKYDQSSRFPLFCSG